MSPFSIDKWTAATVTHVNKRVENHGDAVVHAKDINWCIEGPNTILDIFFPGLRKACYEASETKEIPGVEPSTPRLRTGYFDGAQKLKGDATGYMVSVKHGAVSGASFELAGSEVNTFKVDMKDGGSVRLFFRTQHTGLDAAMMGQIDMIDGKEVEILLAPPAVQEHVADKKGKKKSEDTATMPFKFSVPPGGGIVDNNPTPTDDASEQAAAATQAFIESAKTAAKTERAKRFPAAAKKAAAKKKPAGKK